MCVGGGELWYLTKEVERHCSNSVFHSVGTQGSEDSASLNMHLGTILDLFLISEELQVVYEEAKYAASTLFFFIYFYYLEANYNIVVGFVIH